ncbi:hypothetical protein O181_002763 [Austropuccinia psidii MF-1]|uniref:Uncharacterized protein n=1 Tax=Austropuccinia psidii MF-1 TaxID=1389203 RepID=A0A9Q3BDC4_9BASI|nr:hypothetical protein [Austropuccinia psidii MF-1]
MVVQYDNMASYQQRNNGTLKTLDCNVEKNPSLLPKTQYKQDQEPQLLYNHHTFGKDQSDQGEANRLRMPEPQSTDGGGTEGDNSVSSVSLELMTKDLFKQRNSRNQNNALQA